MWKQWLSSITERISNEGVFGSRHRANHVLVNEYTPGQGIIAHVDGPVFYPTITTINIMGHTVLNLYSPSEDINQRVSNLTYFGFYLLTHLLLTTNLRMFQLILLSNDLINSYKLKMINKELI